MWFTLKTERRTKRKCSLNEIDQGSVMNWTKWINSTIFTSFRAENSIRRRSTRGKNTITETAPLNAHLNFMRLSFQKKIPILIPGTTSETSVIVSIDDDGKLMENPTLRHQMSLQRQPARIRAILQLVHKQHIRRTMIDTKRPITINRKIAPRAGRRKSDTVRRKNAPRNNRNRIAVVQKRRKVTGRSTRLRKR